ncbi:MAG: V-type ATP synthase subunit I [Acidaminococcales bacterium]|jgi:V/A-type H+-transporting ATPase subunit I|nr:V-type ATP synthase subunit I [Acidaminococcales bacterium]
MLIPMKKAVLYALKSDREQILLALQKTGEFMPAPGEGDDGLPGRCEKEQAVEKINFVLKFISTNQEKKKLFEPRIKMPFSDFYQNNEQAQEMAREIEKLSEQIAGLKNEVFNLHAQIEQLNPWQELPERLDGLVNTLCCRLFIGFLPENKLPAVIEQSGAFPAHIQTCGQGEEGRAVFAVCHKCEEAEFAALLKESNFTEAKLPRADLTTAELAERLALEIKEKNALIEDLKNGIEKAAAQKDLLKTLYDKEAADCSRMAAKGEETANTFCLNGWVRYDRQKEIQAAVASVTDAYEIVFRDPAEDEQPPTVTVNKKLIEPYEVITNLYSRPLYTGIDPNPLLAPFYFLFFGIMLSDAGYGIILTILLFLLCRLIKGDDVPGKLARVILMGAVSTIAWGAMFGGWFGMELRPLLFVPMNEPIKMLLLCYSLGALHLAAGMFLKMYMEIKRGNLFGALVDQFSWLTMLAGLAAYVILPDNGAGLVLAAAGMLTILIFAGRENRNIFKRLLGGLTSLYNITGYISDVLSYSRLFALGLATGVIGMVVNTIAGMLWAVGLPGQIAAILVLLGGHSFNIAVNVLGAYVHTSRLQFIEFFGKFYEPGGKEFKPLAFRTRYVDIVK